MYTGQQELKNEIKIDQAAVEQSDLRLDEQRDYLKEGTVMGLSEKIYQGIQVIRQCLIASSAEGFPNFS